MRGESWWQRLTRGTRRVWHQPDWPVFAGADWADRIMSAEVTDQFHAKQGRSTGRWVLHANGRRLTVYLKRHYRLSRWLGMLATFWPDIGWSPAVDECRHLQWAQAQGMPVPLPVAAGEFLGPWGKLQSFLAVEELTGMLPLHEAIPTAQSFFDSRTFSVWKRTLLRELARLTRQLHGRACFHKDLYLCHFFIPAEDTQRVPDWLGRVHLIDLHRLAQHRAAGWIWQVKDLAQLLYSSEIPGIDARDRLAFWRAYLGSRRRTWLARWTRRLILFKWRRYRRHNARTLARRALVQRQEEKAA
jgi:heptose I phosphotransferase